MAIRSYLNTFSLLIAVLVSIITVPAQAVISPAALPVAGKITSPFGKRVHPITGQVRFHSGIDIASPQGKTIVVRQAGEVIYNGTQPGYGRVIVIEHHPLLHTLYAHLSCSHVKTGDWVTVNQPIAAVGQTGAATGPHLHFETHVNTHATNPISYLSWLQQSLDMLDLTYAPILQTYNPKQRAVFYPHDALAVKKAASTPPASMRSLIQQWQEQEVDS